jgi:KDO2-lipid IV(A) lauroyltransferase
VSAVELAYAAGWRVVRALPGPVASTLFTIGADAAVRKGGRGVTRLAENLRRVVGPGLPDDEFDALLHQAMRSYMRYYLEAFRLPSLSAEQVRTGFRLGGDHMLRDDVSSGRGAVVALPHAGNWDAAGGWVAAQGWPITTVAERLKPEGLFRRWLAFRENLGMEIVPLSGGTRAPMEILKDRLRKGAVVPLLADRDLPGRGVEVTFFGGVTTMPPGPALLALRTGSPLYTTDMWYEKEGPRGRLRGPLELPGPEAGPLNQRVRQVTQQVADGLAAGIAEHPADWHMLQRMWREPVTAGTASR